jgi:hypothetical protein
MKYIEMNVIQVAQLSVNCPVLKVGRGLHSNTYVQDFGPSFLNVLEKGLYDPWFLIHIINNRQLLRSQNPHCIEGWGLPPIIKPHFKIIHEVNEESRGQR